MKDLVSRILTIEEDIRIKQERGIFNGPGWTGSIHHSASSLRVILLDAITAIARLRSGAHLAVWMDLCARLARRMEDDDVELVNWDVCYGDASGYWLDSDDLMGRLVGFGSNDNAALGVQIVKWTIGLRRGTIPEAYGDNELMDGYRGWPPSEGDLGMQTFASLLGRIHRSMRADIDISEECADSVEAWAALVAMDPSTERYTFDKQRFGVLLCAMHIMENASSSKTGRVTQPVLLAMIGRIAVRLFSTPGFFDASCQSHGREMFLVRLSDTLEYWLDDFRRIHGLVDVADHNFVLDLIAMPTIHCRRERRLVDPGHDDCRFIYASKNKALLFAKTVYLRYCDRIGHDDDDGGGGGAHQVRAQECFDSLPRRLNEVESSADISLG